MTTTTTSATHPLRLGLAAALALGLGLGVLGCAHEPPHPPAETPAVTVAYPIEREVGDYADYTARTAAVDSVEVRARVTGYLDRVEFKAGALVQKGDSLFEIDPRPYQALLDQAVAKVRQTEAQLKYDEADYRRNLDLFSSGRAVSRQDVEKSQAAVNVGHANLAADRAQVQSRQLDLGFTKIVAPVAGRISRPLVTVGNLVQSGEHGGGTLLTTIVSTDPMYAYFDVDEHTVLRVKQLIREGKAKTPGDEIPVWLGLVNEDGFPHRGTVNFIDNQVNPKIGTLRVRGVFPNQDEALTPGFFARVRVPIGLPYKVLLVSERALDTDQGQKVVYVVEKDGRVALRPVQLGALHDGLRAVTDGLKPDDRVIVNGLQLVRPGVTVKPDLVEMPAAPARKANGT